MRASKAAVRLGWLGLWALCGCFDHGDGAVAGTGGAGDTGGSGGFGGFGGTGGFVVGGSGFAGDGCFDCGTGGGAGSAVPPCPFEDPNCTQEVRSAVCQDLIECSTVAGPLLSLDFCLGAIDARCAKCLHVPGVDGTDAGLADDGGTSEVAACDDAFEGSLCDDFCDLLVQSPQTIFECEALAKGELAQEPVAAQCMCANCFFELEQCVLDDGCWLIAQCAARANCRGTGCFTEDTCLPVLDAVGATSIGASMFTQLADCGNVFCDTLND